ncbi:DUF2087 domain-containing protein [Nocardia sp. CDC159]|uniref:DUF2087 domain-containing protein n=1 Tax=Nocardia pulmonis TaxID=2951408 RepID=A0A9X2IWB2_9NOCA|nr:MULTISPECIES: DUF2087 domain-containing protein [Nocardia]MCM6774113.1 DUF2087 domain-containing protein [Nocardia pulmonis]MCM6787000.1 DUF2087 domain-containing protein [Nocardia sp. CDC159]
MSKRETTETVTPIRSRPDGGSGSSDPAIDRLFRDGRLMSMPSLKSRHRAVREQLLSHIARTHFDPNVLYTEKQVNRRLARIFDDHVALRRYLVETGRLDRTRDGARYWLPGTEQPVSTSP